MTWHDLGAAAVLVACLAAPAISGIRVGRHLSQPGDTAGATVAGLVAGLVQMVIVGQALGAVGQLAVTQATLATWGVTLAVVVLTRGTKRRWSVPRLPRTAAARWVAAIVVVVAALAVVLALAGPSREPDTIHYHVSNAVHWLQSGSTWTLPFAEPADHTAADPGNGELVGLWLMLPSHDDRLVTLAPLVFAALCIAGVAAVTRRLGGDCKRGILAGLVATVCPALWFTQERSFDTDLLAAGGIIAAAALLLDRRADNRVLRTMLAGSALGLASGSKYAALGPALATAVVLLWRPARPLLLLSAAATGVAVTGAFWYVRNAAATGDPLWPQTIAVPGGHVVVAGSAVPLPATESLLANLSAGRFAVIPIWVGVATLLLGPVLFLAGAGVAAGLARRVGREGSRDATLVGVAAGLCMVVYWATPLTGGGAGLDTAEIGQDVRFCLPALLLGGALAAALLRPRVIDLAAGAGLAWAVALDIDASRYRDDLQITPGVLGAAIALCAAAALAMWTADHVSCGASGGAARTARGWLQRWCGATAGAALATGCAALVMSAGATGAGPGLGLPDGARVAVVDVHDVRALLAPGYTTVVVGVGSGGQGALTPIRGVKGFDAALVSLHPAALAVGRLIHSARPDGWSPSRADWRWIGVVGDADVYAPAETPRIGGPP